MSLRPPVPYFGGKMRIGPAIAALLPEHGHYVEPFCGSLAVLMAKSPSDHETVNDLDGDVMAFWRVLRDQPAALARACALTPHSRAEHEAARDLEEPDELERARRVFVRLTQGRSGQLRATGWRHYVKPAGTMSMLDYLAAYVERIAPAAERLAHVSLECLPALEVIAKYGAEPDVLLYVDPPYLGSTRTRSQDGYRNEMRSPDEHRELAEALRAARAAVVISGYPCDLYDLELYAGWDRHTFTAGTGQGEGANAPKPKPKAPSGAWVHPLPNGKRAVGRPYVRGLCWKAPRYDENGEFSHYHEGVDLSVHSGMAIRAVHSGRIIRAGWRGGYGYAVEVRHGNVTTLYAHASRIIRSKGTVKKGETIARVGSTGHSFGPHLHIEVKVNGKKVNPSTFLRARGVKVGC